MLAIMEIHMPNTQHFKDSFYKYCTWHYFKRLDNHKIVSTSPVWLFALSGLSYISGSNIFQGTPSPSGTDGHNIITFPVFLFIVSAFIILIAKTIYIIFCPEIVYQYNSPHDYKDKGRGSEYLINQIKRYAKSSHFNKAKLIDQNVLIREPGYTCDQDKLDNYVFSNEINGFWCIYDLASSTNTTAQKWCFYLYIAGFALTLAGYVGELLHLLWKIL